MEINKKISVKTVVGGPKDLRLLLGNLPSLLIMEVFGEVTDIETGKSDFKDEDGEPRIWTKLLGQFKARNLGNKRQFFSGSCFLPDVIMDMIVSNFKICKSKGMQTLQFACLIGIKPNEDIATGYEYYATSLMPPDEESDPFKAIEAKAQAYRTSLPAPGSSEQQMNDFKP